ncbi:TIGR00725 family protein, partial [bacterium]|nr:TIGR00725 family protein [bacterium]
IIVNASQAVIAVDGKYGTLSEIAFCLQLSIPVVSLFSWNIDESIITADNPEQAVNIAFSSGK